MSELHDNAHDLPTLIEGSNGEQVVDILQTTVPTFRTSVPSIGHFTLHEHPGGGLVVQGFDPKDDAFLHTFHLTDATLLPGDDTQTRVARTVDHVSLALAGVFN